MPVGSFEGKFVIQVLVVFFTTVPARARAVRILRCNKPCHRGVNKPFSEDFQAVLNADGVRVALPKLIRAD